MSKRRRAVPPLAAALIADRAYRSTPVYTAPVRIRTKVAESAGTLTREVADAEVTPVRPRVSVREAPTVVGPVEGKPGRLLVKLIQAGWSLNGVYYSAEVLKRDGATAWPAGTLNYVDHDTDAEEESRPSGSLTRLASYQTTPARWDDQQQGLVAEVRVFAPWREAVMDWAESGAIGMSIRAWVYAEHGEAEGRKGLIVGSIAEGRSCDYVTVPAAGGAILSVLESARQRTAEARNIGAWLESRLHLALTQLGDDLYGDGRLTREERITLSSAIGDALTAYTARVEADQPQLYQRDLWSYPEPAATPAEEARRTAEATVEERRAALGHEIAEMYGDADTYTWVRDFDPDQLLVWFDTCPHDGDNTTWQQAYEVADDGQVSLAGDRIEVIARTVYDPAPAEDEPSDAATTEEAASPTPEPAEADVTDGAPPTAPNPPTEEEPEMSGAQTGAPPVQAGTATVADTPPAATTEAANAAVLEAMQALTRQVTALTEANATLARRADERDAADRAARNRATAREAVEAGLNADTIPADLRTQIAPRVTAAVLASIPTAESGDVDAAALGQRIAEAVAAESGYAAQLLESAGVGRPSGLGSSAPKVQTAEEFEAKLTEGFRALGLTAEAAAVAAKGRG